MYSFFCFSHVSWAAKRHIRMFFEGSCDTDYWNNGCWKFSFAITGLLANHIFPIEKKERKKEERRSTSLLSYLIGGDVGSLENLSLCPQRNSNAAKIFFHIKHTNMFLSPAFCCFFECYKLLVFHSMSQLQEFEYFVSDLKNQSITEWMVGENRKQCRYAQHPGFNYSQTTRLH